MRAGQVLWTSLVVLASASAWAQEEKVGVGFDKAQYVSVLGESIPVRVELKSTLPVGLFSYGLRLVYDPQMGGVTDVTRISVPPELDFNGVMGPGTQKEVGNGFAAVKGTIDFFVDPAPFYMGTLLAIFDVKCPQMGDYLLALELYRTLGPAESVFVLEDGSVLDDLIVWGVATISVIPETETVFLVAVGMGCIWMVRRR